MSLHTMHQAEREQGQAIVQPTIGIIADSLHGGDGLVESAQSGVPRSTHPPCVPPQVCSHRPLPAPLRDTGETESGLRSFGQQSLLEVLPRLLQRIALAWKDHVVHATECHVSGPIDLRQPDAAQTRHANKDQELMGKTQGETENTPGTQDHSHLFVADGHHTETVEGPTIPLYPSEHPQKVHFNTTLLPQEVLREKT